MYFSDLIDSFDIFATSEHCLFAEQLEILEASSNYIYNCIAVSSEDNPSILSGKPAHGGVALVWKKCFNDLVKPLENIDSDRIVGIRCDFKEKSPLLSSVYICPLRAIVSRNLMNTLTISGHYMNHYPPKAL